MSAFPGVISVEAFQTISERFGEWANTWILKVYKKYLKAVVTEITGNTPVDTGRARANWVLSPHGHDYSISGPPPFPNILLENLNLIKSLKQVTDLQLNNNLFYILALDAGSSRQAPQGIIDISLRAVDNEFNEETGRPQEVSLEELMASQREDDDFSEEGNARRSRSRSSRRTASGEWL